MGNSKITLIILSIIATVFLAVLVGGVYMIRSKNQATSVLLLEAERVAEAENLARSIRSLREEASEDIESFEEIALNEDKLVPLIENIEDAGETLGIDANVLSVSEKTDAKQTQPTLVTITLETEGAWPGTLAFLRAIESLPQRVTIDESIFSKDETSWRTRIVLSVYSFD